MIQLSTSQIWLKWGLLYMQGRTYLNDDNVDIAQQHVPAQLQKFLDDDKLERRDGVVLSRVLLRLGDLQTP